MQFGKNNLKVYISRIQFYSVLSIVVLFILINTVFFAINMDPVEIAKNYNNLYDGRLFIILSYVTSSVVLSAFGIYCFFSYTHRVSIGYLFAAVWSVFMAAIVIAPIVFSGTFVQPQNLINLGLFVVFIVAWFFVYKDLYEQRRFGAIHKVSKKTREEAW